VPTTCPSVFTYRAAVHCKREWEIGKG
jgi:hypothetical protein